MPTVLLNVQPYPLWCGVVLDPRETPEEEIGLTAQVGRVIGWTVDNSSEEAKTVVPVVALENPGTGETEPAVGLSKPTTVAMFVRDSRNEALAAAKSYVEHGKAVKPRRKAIVVR